MNEHRTLGWNGDIDSNKIEKMREIATEKLLLWGLTWQSIFADLKVFRSSALGKLGFKWKLGKCSFRFSWPHMCQHVSTVYVPMLCRTSPAQCEKVMDQTWFSWSVCKKFEPRKDEDRRIANGYSLDWSNFCRSMIWFSRGDGTYYSGTPTPRYSWHNAFKCLPKVNLSLSLMAVDDAT